MSRMIFWLMVGCLLFSFGCGDDDDDNDVQVDDDAVDDDAVDDDAVDDDAIDDDVADDDTGGEDLPQWLEDRPYLQNRSLWSQEIDMSQPPKLRKLGVIAAGNGKVFGILGNQFPLGSWHNLGGPNYQMDLKWFSDYEPWMYVAGKRVQPTHQAISRVRKTPIAIAGATDGLLEWTSVNFAPKYASDTLAEQALISVWIVRNVSEKSATDASITIDSNLGVFRGSGLWETNFEERFMNVRPLGLTAQAADSINDMSIPLGIIAPGEEIVFVLPYVFTKGEDDPEMIFNAIETAGVDALLESTVQWWENWFAQATQVITPDEKFNDLIRTLILAIKINQAESGGLSQMSQYSHTWLRDTMGPAMFYSVVGLTEDLRDMLDYLWGAIVIRGNLGNAQPLDLDITNLPPEPDWENLPELTGFTRAEGPSHLPLQYREFYRATGDLEPLEERYGMLKHALVHQQFIDGCMQYFSGDETFEDVMEAAFGFNIIPDPDTEWLSTNSSCLMIAAARFMAEVADLLGFTDDAEMFGGMADDFVDCLENTFWNEEKSMYAVMVDTITREPWPHPYEDVNTMPIWWRSLPLDDPHIVDNFETLMSTLGRENGTAVSPLAWPYTAIFHHVTDGVQTGMSHGYYLDNLTRMFHPMADVAFERWQDIFSPSGNLDEAVSTDDYGHLSMLREPFGIVCDVSARYRSWEAGIVGYAYFEYLTGFAPDVAAGRIALAPHLPPGWDQMRFENMQFGEDHFDLIISDAGNGERVISLTTDEAAGFELELTVPLDGEVTGIVVNDQDLPAGQYESRQNDYGRTIVALEPFLVEAGSEVEIEVQYAQGGK